MEYSSQKKIMEEILIIAAHPDDEVLGCGASIAKWKAAGNSVNILIMAEGETSRSKFRDSVSKKTKLLVLNDSAKKAGEILGVSSVKLLDFPDNRMDSLDRLDIIKAIEEEVSRLRPTIVVTHHWGDLNIDHRVTHEAVITACRPQPGNTVKQILAFEIPSSTEWQINYSGNTFNPNWFEDVTENFDIKLEALKCYQSEMREWPHPRSNENVRNLAKYRGSSVGYRFAEAFILLRKVQ